METMVKWIWVSLVVSVVLGALGFWGLYLAVRDGNFWQGIVAGGAVVVGLYGLIVSGSVFVR